MRFALAPLQWLATEDGGMDRSRALPLPTLVSKVRRLGFTAVKAEPPDGVDVADYARALADGGLLPAPGYLSAELERAEQRGEIVARAGAFAATLRALGLGEMLIAARVVREAPRWRRPAVGAEADPRRLGEIAKTLELVGAETRRHGVTSCLHPHVGSWVETQAEVDWLLERIDSTTLALGPDTGHLGWAGADVIDFARRHADRIKAVHLKDVRLDVARRTRGTDATYRDVVREGIWAEPGLGDLDLVGFLDALEARFDGWVLVEVDKSSVGSPEESIAACSRWVRDHHPGDRSAVGGGAGRSPRPSQVPGGSSGPSAQS